MPIYSAPFIITAPPPVPGPLLLNGTDLATLGFVLESAPGWKDAPPRSTPSVVRPGRAGAYRSAATQEGTRKLTLQGVVRGDTFPAVRKFLDGIRALLMVAQPAVLTFPDDASRFVNAYLDQFVSDVGAGPSMIATALNARLDFSLLDPYAYDVVLQTLVLSAAVVRAPLGTAPSFPLITLTGASVNPTFSLYRYDGTLMGSLTLTITMAGGDSLVIDMDRKTILKNGVSVIASLSGGDFFALDPALVQNGRGLTPGDQGYVTVSSGSGTMSLRRAWR